MERLVHRIRHSSMPPLIVQDDDLVAMAADPAIQQELQHIAAEFAVTEAVSSHQRYCQLPTADCNQQRTSTGLY